MSAITLKKALLALTLLTGLVTSVDVCYVMGAYYLGATIAGPLGEEGIRV